VLPGLGLAFAAMLSIGERLRDHRVLAIAAAGPV
jgi:hypothetical protein